MSSDLLVATFDLWRNKFTSIAEEPMFDFKDEQYLGKDKASHFDITASSSKVKYVMEVLNRLK